MFIKNSWKCLPCAFVALATKTPKAGWNVSLEIKIEPVESQVFIAEDAKKRKKVERFALICQHVIYSVSALSIEAK